MPKKFKTNQTTLVDTMKGPNQGYLARLISTFTYIRNQSIIIGNLRGPAISYVG
jgi:hypothetical protein